MDVGFIEGLTGPALAGLTGAAGGDFMVTVSFTETYDLSTRTNKMTLIGVHVPSKGIFKRLYPGFLMQYRKCKIVSQDVNIACASMLPADPLQVGVTAGDIAPEDLFNPILYKAMTNDSWSNLEARINGFSNLGEGGLSAEGFSAEVSKNYSTDIADEFGIYYSLLANRRGWKIANPQRGLALKNLRPLVFERWYSHGENEDTDASAPGLSYVSEEQGGDNGVEVVQIPAKSMRGRAHPMPSFNTTYVCATLSSDGRTVPNGMSQNTPGGTFITDGVPYNFQNDMPDIPHVMTAAIVIPPSRLHQLFYRMTVTTRVSFFSPRSMNDVTSFNHSGELVDPAVYFSDYSYSSKLLTNEESSVDVSEDATLSKIMESAN